jgi:hypothetical protein
MANILMLEGSSFHNSVEVPGSLNGLHCIVLYCIVLLMSIEMVMVMEMVVEVQESMLEFVLFIRFLIDMGIVFVVDFVLTSDLCW